MQKIEMQFQKKILIITSEFPPLPGGIGNHALNLALSLSKEGIIVTVIADQRSAVINEDFSFDKQLPFSVKRIERKKNLFITYLKRITETFRFLRFNKDATVICSGKFSLWIGGLISLFFYSRKKVAVIHGSEINAGGKISKAITKWAINRFNGIVAVSNFTKDLVLNKNKKLKMTVINNGFNVPQTNFNNKTNDNHQFSIITVGNVTNRKGQQNVIKALPLLKEKFPNILYNIVGIPTEKDNFKRLADSLFVGKNVKFHDVLPNQQLYSILNSAKVFFMLSNNLKSGDVEGFGIAVLEANALGIPAIGSYNTGIADAIKDGFSGKLVNPKNANEILISLTDIMNNYDKYSENAKIWAENFTWNKIIKKYIEFIE